MICYYLLETSSKGIVTHGMLGFDYEHVRQNLNIPSDFDVMAMIITGIWGPHENIPTNPQVNEFLNDQ